ncbi:Uncharacterized protein SCF082_LOCUS6128 [Durusdinium trenchii]|uniref:Uncharacterized protein n=1 Tax=Durusdinium trenchii TaxID=1381693 RepID=A0ABP0I9L5_9DINO
MVDLMEVSCIWSKIQDEMEVHIGRGPALDTIKKAWSEGSLDSELRAHSKNMEPGWDFRKLSFVLEAKGEVQQEELSRAQSNISSALQSSLNAGFNLFKTNLESDQLLHRRHLLASSGDEARARAAIVGQLEVKAPDDEELCKDEVEGDGEIEGDGADHESEDEPCSDAILRDFNYRLKCILMERERGLTVKQAVASFEPSTLYGNRVGFQDILLVTSSKGNNIFHKSKLWKTALVTDISMLPRQQMLKPPRPDNRYGVDTRFTKVQEMKQASFVSGLIANKLFAMCRSAEYTIPGFPDFQAAIKDLKKSTSQVMPLWGLIKALEEAGEVNCKVAEHRLTKDAGSIKIEPETTVCFLLDALKASALTFGAKTDLAKTRSNKTVSTVWRLRCPFVGLFLTGCVALAGFTMKAVRALNWFQ